ncbi:hypothetical protein FCV25MIE_04714 [Fagus crenata]
MADQKSSGIIPIGWILKNEVQKDGSKLSDLIIRPETFYSSFGISLSLKLEMHIVRISLSSSLAGIVITSLDGLHSDTDNTALERPLV